MWVGTFVPGAFEMASLAPDIFSMYACNSSAASFTMRGGLSAITISAWGWPSLTIQLSPRTGVASSPHTNNAAPPKTHNLPFLIPNLLLLSFQHSYSIVHLIGVMSIRCLIGTIEAAAFAWETRSISMSFFLKASTSSTVAASFLSSLTIKGKFGRSPRASCDS